MKAFCPGHITCFFQPADSYDPMSTGSRGLGIRLSRGADVEVNERSDQRIEVMIDGTEASAEITRLALRVLASDRGFDVHVNNELPMRQGFGMSAAGAIAAGLCVCAIAGMKRSEAFKAAHLAEVYGGGGLGDVAGIMSDRFLPLRTVAGMPPFGKVVEGGRQMKVNVAVIGDEIDTASIINGDTRQRIIKAGMEAMDAYSESSGADRMFRISRKFSAAAGVEGPMMKDALETLGNRAGMCMLGNSVFSTLPESELSDVLGVDVIQCTSTVRKAEVTRRA